MAVFTIPPKIVSGELVVGDTRLKASDFQWKSVPLDDQFAANESGERTTSVGHTEVDGHTVRVVLGFKEDEKLPFFSITLWGNAETRLSTCSFNFEEVRS